MINLLEDTLESCYLANNPYRKNMNTNFNKNKWEEICKLYNLQMLDTEVINDKIYFKIEFPRNIAYITEYPGGYTSLYVYSHRYAAGRSRSSIIPSSFNDKIADEDFKFVSGRHESFCLTNATLDLDSFKSPDLLTSNFIEIDFSDFFKGQTVNVTIQHVLDTNTNKLFKLQCQNLDDDLIRSLAFDILNRNEHPGILADLIKDKYLNL